MPTMERLIAPLFMRRLVRSPRGRAFVLHQAADAEGSDEGRVFDELLAVVDDDKVRKLVRLHQDDETRHAELFSAAAAKLDVPTPELPDHLKLLERIDDALGGFFDQFARGERSIMEIYLLLQVIEERATTQFAILEPALRRVDPEAADMLETIIADEQRHLKYCRAISRQYAPSEEEREERLRELREVEARVYGEHARANMEHCLDEGLADIPAREMPMWRALLRLGQQKSQPVPSAFFCRPSRFELLRESVRERARAMSA